MANTKISALTAATTPVAGTEVLPIVQSSATVKLAISDLTPGLSTITAAKGGTGQTSYAVGDLLYASATTTLSKLADVATGNALISGGIGVAPSYGKIGLTTHVSGTLPVANGGTNLTSFTANGVVYASSTSALATGSTLVFDGTNLGVGASSPAAKFDVSTSSAAIARFNSSAANGGYVLFPTGTSNFYLGSAASLVGGSANDFLMIGSAGNLLFGTSNSVRGSFASSGEFIAGGQTVRDSAKLTVETSSNGMSIYVVPNTSAVDFAIFRANSGTLCGNISRVGTTSAVTYASVSDYRLKENIAPMTGALDKVAKLKPVTYTWKESGVFTNGFIAHELQEIVPDCVVGEKDAVDKNGDPKYQAVDASFLIATLTSAIQEQQTLIIQLQADVAELKNKP